MKAFILLSTVACLGVLWYANKEARRIAVAQRYSGLVLRYAVDPTLEVPDSMQGRNFILRWFAGLLDRTRFQEWLLGVLELADIKVKPAQAVIYAVLIDIVLAASFTTWTGSLLVSEFWAVVLIGLATWQVINSKQKHRRMAFEKALPDFLMMLASSLRAGLSLQRGIEAVSSEGDGEVERQLRRASTEIAMGVQPDAALEEVAKRMKSQDMQWVVVAIGIQRKVGGNLASVLDLVSDTIRARETIRQEVRAVSSEGRMSANVLVALPVGVFVMMIVTRREYAEVLWVTSTGRALLFTTVALVTSGMLWIRSMVAMD